MRTTIRPSALPHLDACPRWVPRAFGNTAAIEEAAEEGSYVHAFMEKLVAHPVAEWEQLLTGDSSVPPALVAVLIECAEQVRDLFSLGLPVTKRVNRGLYELDALRPEGGVLPDGLYCECGLSSHVTAPEIGAILPGTGDLVMIQGNRAVYVDYKTNRVARDHDRQCESYVLGVFEAAPHVEFVTVRIVAPRLSGVHAPVQFTRADVPRLRQEHLVILQDAADPFTPGEPCDSCVLCAGNGRCPYQAASLQEVPVREATVVRSATWSAMLQAVTPELRGARRRLVKWLDSFVDAVKEDDKTWSLANPNAEIPGFMKVVQAGRATLDKTQLSALHEELRCALGFNEGTLLSFSVPDRGALTDFLKLRGADLAEAQIQTLATIFAKYSKRGQPIIAYRAVKDKTSKQVSAPGRVAGVIGG